MQPVTVANLGLIRDERNRFLLGEKTEGAEIGAGLINFAGGKKNPDETVLESMARELYEEFGIIVDPDDLSHIGILDCYAGTVFKQRVHVYLVKKYVGIPHETSSMRNLAWYEQDALPFDRMHEGDRYWLPTALRGRRFRIRMFYESPGKGYIDHIEDEY